MLRVQPAKNGFPGTHGAAENPARIYIETTTRCNLRCAMCVKQAGGSDIGEGDFDMDLFPSIERALPGVRSLILNGIGEPLLYPHLEELVRRARGIMPEDGSIGFQTNGMLLDEGYARRLVRAGLDRICLSLDAVSPERFRSVRGGGDIRGVERSLGILKRAGGWGTRPLTAGIEFVFSRETMDQLVPAIRWAGERGAGFFIVTHLISYDSSMTAGRAYDQNTDRAVAIFEEWSARAARGGVDLNSYFTIICKYLRTPEEEQVVRFVDEMTARAHDENVFFNLKGLFERDRGIRHAAESIFREAEDAALQCGIELILPEISPTARKRCEFIETGSVFISWRGDVHPCHFLWHRYSCYVSGWHKHVTPRVFGNLARESLLGLWESRGFRDFRETVLRYAYPLCSNCTWAPCDYIYSESFEQDCYANTIPCGDCQWCLGVFQCMG